jgi:hypothetical protein
VPIGVHKLMNQIRQTKRDANTRGIEISMAMV